MWKASTGIEKLDSIFGGYQSRTLTMFFGRTGTGKTTMSGYVPIMSIYKHMIEKHNGELPESLKFIFIDCDGGFDFERACEIWENNDIYRCEIEDHIEYYQPTTFEEQHDYIKDLDKLIDKNGWEPVLITCDAMCAIYRGVILRTPMKTRASVIGSYTGKLDLQLTYLRKLGVEYDCPIIVTTWTGSPVGEAMGSEGELPFIGGRQFGFLPKTIIELDAESLDKPDRVARLFKSRSKPAGQSAIFQLCNEGIKSL